MKKYTLSKVSHPGQVDYIWKKIREFDTWQEARDEAVRLLELKYKEGYDSGSNGEIEEGFIGYKEDKSWTFKIE